MMRGDVHRWQTAALALAAVASAAILVGFAPPAAVVLPVAAMGGTLFALRAAIRRSQGELERQRDDAEIERRHLTNTRDEVERINGLLRSRENELLEAVGRVEMSREAYRIASLRFEELFAGFPVPTFSYDATGQIFEWNRAAEVLTGIEAKDAFGRDVTDVFTQSPDFADFHRDVRRVFDGDSISGFERSLCLGDKGTRHLLCSSFPLRTVGRRISGGVTALLDVTAHVASEQKFRTLFEGGNDAYIVLSRKGTILEANSQAKVLFGGAFERDPTGRAIADFVPEDHQRTHAAFLRKTVRREIARSEWRYRNADGESLDVEVAISGNLIAGESVVLMQIHDLNERKRFEADLQAAVSELERAQAIGRIGSWEVDLKSGRFTLSQEMFRVVGWGDDRQSPLAREFVRFAHPDDREGLMKGLRDCARDGEGRELHHRILGAGGEMRYAVSRLQPLPAEGRIVGTLQDVTERKLEELKVLESETKLRAIVDASDAGIMVVDAELKLVLANAAAKRLFGVAEGQPVLTDGPYETLLDSELRPVDQSDKPIVAALKRGEAIRNAVFAVRDRDERVSWVSFSTVPIWTGPGREPQYAVASFADVTDQRRQQLEIQRFADDLERKNKELKELNGKLKRLATIDGLTSLSNHRTFHEFLDAQSASHTELALLMVDVDRFKEFNDSFGHRAGDMVLRKVAEILKQHCRRGDLAARYGGEEFVLVLPGSDAEMGLAIAERLRAAIEAATWTNREITISIGVATKSEASAPADLIEAADQALYASKRAGRNRVTLAESRRRAA